MLHPQIQALELELHKSYALSLNPKFSTSLKPLNRRPQDFRSNPLICFSPHIGLSLSLSPALHMSYSLNTLTGRYIGDYIGHYYGGYSGGILGVWTIAHTYIYIYLSHSLSLSQSGSPLHYPPNSKILQDLSC